MKHRETTRENTARSKISSTKYIDSTSAPIHNQISDHEHSKKKLASTFKQVLEIIQKSTSPNSAIIEVIKLAKENKIDL